MSQISPFHSPPRRALLLDLFTFVFNLLILSALVSSFASLSARTGAGSKQATALMAGFCLAVVYLQPLTAILKRPLAHQSNPQLNQTYNQVMVRLGSIPILVYFGLQVAFLIYACVLLVSLAGSASGLTVLLFLSLPLLAALNTYLVRLYFFPPEHVPPVMAHPLVELLGDACIFANTLCFQVLWWYLLSDPAFSTTPGSLGALAGRLLALTVMFIFFCLPPRLFYLPEAFGSPLVWASILLANLPILARALLGVG